MATESIETAAPQVIIDQRMDCLQHSFINDSGADLTEGQEVCFKAAGTLDKRDAGSDIPIGIVVKAGKNGERVVVRMFNQNNVNAIAIGGTINPGTFVKPNGVKNASGLPQYVACVAGDYTCAMVINGGAVNSVIIVAILNAPFQLNPAP